MLRPAASFGEDSSIARGRAGCCHSLACSSRRTLTTFAACPRSLCQCENLACTPACRSVACCRGEIRTSWGGHRRAAIRGPRHRQTDRQPDIPAKDNVDPVGLVSVKKYLASPIGTFRVLEAWNIKRSVP